MDKRVVFSNKLLPWLLVAPQLAITIVFFFLPAGKAIWQSFFIEDTFGGSTEFVLFDNFAQLWNLEYFHSFGVSFLYAFLVTFVGLALALLLAVMANRVIRGSTIYKTVLILPYAVAPAIVGVLWSFLFSPAIGTISNYITSLGFDWNPNLNSSDAMTLIVIATVWQQISYNFLFFLAGLQSIPSSLIEAAAIDGASPAKRFWSIVFPLLSPVTFFLVVMNMVYAFFETFAIIDTTTQGGPGTSTNILVYNVYKTAFHNYDYGSSGAQSVILMILVIGLTFLQFRYVDRKVQYT
ncbi:sn-glycerol-3-phosphate ABC transporter permease UgpA [Basilea psittacipulmonis]|uniref:sn-glycerol-3-phosphate transport system permease protein UgpA n=1 Tax=Basilea psittacipulmonis DSM 24701 TaxID=1072685 RepID=A0A077DD58_9BURK|nr:sn-glycerol-3-phosphate ABC transporter permease UgpA [Basilea psittacipulmonis]AIL32539.1 glycerol-3-phosphate transporter permease [Basilea psittacipulmonis DSM 24701]